MKRTDYINWDEYFMGVATLSGMRSKDPNTQVGACIVSEEHKILSMGYTAFRRAVRMTTSRGRARANRLRTSISIQRTAN